MLLESRGDGNNQYNDWLYGESEVTVPAGEAAAVPGLARIS
jgi:hypothetical protein